MKINKQSNIYTVLYLIVIVIVVGVGLAVTSTALKPRQTANADADKMRQILASVGITPSRQDIIKDFDRYVTGQLLVTDSGDANPGDAFGVDVALQIKKPDDQRLLPLYKCTLEDGAVKYIIPMYGAGLWGPVWGYVAVDADGSTIYGAYFAHQGETPGLGAEIEKPEFSNRFKGLNLFVDNDFRPVSVVKAGQPSPDGSETVDAISGGTITSKGVNDMLHNCLEPYGKFLDKLKKRQ